MTKRRQLRFDPAEDDPPARRRTVRDPADDPQPTQQSRSNAYGESNRGNGYGGGGGSNLRGTRAERILPYQNTIGRPKGTPNRVTVVLKQAVMLAAEDVGEDGNGLDGVRGYMRRLAINEPSVFAQLLRRIMPVQVRTDIDPRSTLGQVLDAVKARVEMEKAKVIEVKPRQTWTRE